MMVDIDVFRKNKKVKVLIIEDDEILGKIYFKALRMEGFKVNIVSMPKSATQILEKKKFNLILLDLMLQGESGIEVLEYINNLNIADPKLSILVLSNVQDLAMIEKCSHLKVNEFLPKSDYTPTQIVNKVQEYFL